MILHTMHSPTLVVYCLFTGLYIDPLVEGLNTLPLNCMVHFDNILHTVCEDKILTLLLYNKKKREPQSFLFPFELQFRISWAEKSQSHTHQLLMVTLLKYYQKKGLPCGLPHMSLRAQLLAVERLEWRSLKSEPVQNCACSIDVMWLDLPSRGSNPVIFFVR